MISTLRAVSRLPVGFVGEQHRWLRNDGPGDRDALHLSTRELRRRVRFPPGESDRGERFARTRVPRARADATIEERELDILERGCAVEQIEPLKDEPRGSGAAAARAAAVTASRRPLRESDRYRPSAGRGSRGCSWPWTCQIR